MMPFEKKNIAGIEYTEHGDGEPIIFLHGIGGGAASFDQQLQHLKAYRCIAWNMPGYESSVADRWPPTFKFLSDTLGTFIEALGFNKVHLAGQSLGGMLCLEHAMHRREQIASLIIMASTPAFGGADESFKQAFLKARLAPLDAGDTMAQVASVSAPRLVGPIATTECVSEVERILSRVSEKTWRGILECLVTFNRRENLVDIDVPCCLIAGSHDQNAPAKTMQKASETLPTAEYHLIEGAGHMLNQEAHLQTNAIIEQFLQKQTA